MDPISVLQASELNSDHPCDVFTPARAGEDTRASAGGCPRENKPGREIPVAQEDRVTAISMA